MRERAVSGHRNGLSLALALALALTWAMALGAVGCGDDTTGGTGDTIVNIPEDTCTPGTALCECSFGSCPGAQGLACIDDVCVFPSCTLGELDCACEADGSCGADEYGRQLTCLEGTCALEDCVAGDLGCTCAAGGGCVDDLVCQDLGAVSLCMPFECTDTGVEGCPCNSDRSCDGGLACVQGSCIDAGDCVLGATDCPCRRDGGCAAGNTCNTATDYCEAVLCTPGELGCSCDDGDCSGDDIICTDDLCEVDDCPAGDEGCECNGDRCGLNDRGEQLVCTEGRCESEDCVPGDVGCVCAGGTSCHAGGSCNDGFCIADGCVRGELSCACASGSPACDVEANLTCRGGAICVDNSGYTGGTCRSDGSCERGNACVAETCEPCVIGATGCSCTRDGGCNSSGLMCMNDTCVAESDFVALIPEEPLCYTPCTEGWTDDLGTADVTDDVYHGCPSNSRLMAGCGPDLVCNGGTCGEEGDPQRSCESDIDCPDYQSCMYDGHCYSNCEDDTDCGGAYECYRYVCRQPCDADEDTCPSDTYCNLVDLENGYCMAEIPSTGTGDSSPTGVLGVSQDHISFSNVDTQATFTITNDSPEFARVRIRRLDHQRFADDGTSESLMDFDDDEACTSGVDCPLYWLDLGTEFEEGSRDTEIEVIVEAESELDIVVGNAGGAAVATWSGTLELVSERIGTQQVSMTYVERPEGQWRGSIYYFSQFDDTDLAAWAADATSRADTNLQDDVNNAFVQRWTAFRRGQSISWEHMQAVMLATQTQSWEEATDLPGCTFPVCYYYTGDSDGIVGYTSDAEDIPVPTGVTELPFAMNLYMPSPTSDPDRMEGRIESATALHYAGNPAVSLRFQALDEGDEGDCNTIASGGACLRYIESFDATIHVGGRYAPGADATSCTARSDGSLALYEVPWLLDDFQRDTFTSGGVYYRQECRDAHLPYEDDLAANLALASSNPIPDGRTRRRELTLLDGVLINQETMVILFEEKMDSFFCSPGFVGCECLDGDGCYGEGIACTDGTCQVEVSGDNPDATALSNSSYGWMVLQREPTELDDSDADGNRVADVFEGSAVEDARDDPDDILAVSCSEELQFELDFDIDDLDAETAADVISELILGLSASVDSTPLGVGSDEQVHYFCEDTGLFDGGPDNDTDHGTEISGQGDTCAADIPGVCQDGGYNAAIVSNECEADEDESVDPSCLVRRSECALGTDLSDCGVRYTDDRDVRVSCPVGSEVVFFTVSGLDQDDIAGLDCQQDGSCQDTLNDWASTSEPIVQFQPVYRCQSGGAYCDLNRFDLRDGKEFFPAGSADAVLSSFRSELESAFRYRTRFRNRTSGSTVGFAPEVCIPNSDQIPYCYDPDQIEALRDRVDCLLAIWEDDLYLDMQDSGNPTYEDAIDLLDEFLAFNFSYEEACVDGTDDCDCSEPYACDTYDGFERLYSELLIMMGDESYTEAFASRFDLAGTTLLSFDGESFEDGGINLSGVAGYEMYSLYRAVQYYKEALDRFYALSPLVWQAVSESIGDRQDVDDEWAWRDSFVTPEMVSSYMERLLRASTQTARAYSAVAERYQSFNEADLARTVIERAYTGTYLESAVISRLMQRIRDSYLEADQAQINQVLTDGQIRYRMAMLDMRNVYSSISDEMTLYGLDPDYIPFPVLNPDNYNEDNGFEKLRRRAWERLEIARAREQAAIESNRSYETDAAQFQSELTRIRTTYDSQLAQICGTFSGDDGRIYPAIRRYAFEGEWTSSLGDPCGLVGNGDLYNALVQIDIVGVSLAQIQQRYANVFERIDIEQNRVAAECDFIEGQANYVMCLQTGDDSFCNDIPADAPLPECDEDIFTAIYDLDGAVTDIVEQVSDIDFDELLEEAGFETECTMISLNDEIRESRQVQHISNTVLAQVNQLASLTKCSVGASTDCPGAAVGILMGTTVAALNETIYVTEQTQIDNAERELQMIGYMQGYYQTTSECARAGINAEASMQTMLLELGELDLEVLRTQYELQLALANIQRLRNEAVRIQLEQEEIEQMTINIEAARNDPNIRLYRNDAIINADIAFEDAVRQAYRATRVFEYYTSTSYANRDQLYLTRMISSGDYNLENYLIALENAYQEFEEIYGEPDLRPEIISVRDDLLRIPWEDENGVAYDQTERVQMFREALTDPSLLNDEGHLTIPFSTDTSRLSPLTRVHKLLYIEVDIIASDYGDEVARVNLRQFGTAGVHNLDNSWTYYRFPERTAVIDAFFGGTRYFDASVYRGTRLLDRPFANTAWELVINQRDDRANQDIDLQSVSDIRLYVYYRDFTP